MLRLTDEQVEWLAERVSDAPVSPRGGRPATDKRLALRGIFWILDNGAKWKDLPRRFGSKSAVHRWFTHPASRISYSNTPARTQPSEDHSRWPPLDEALFREGRQTKTE